jgi:porin
MRFWASITPMIVAAALPLSALAATDTGDSFQAERAQAKAETKSGAKPASDPDKNAEANSDTKSDRKPDDKAGDDSKKPSDNGGDKSNEKSGDKSDQKTSDKDEKKSDDKSDDFWSRKNLLGDIGVLRPALQQHGMTLAIVDTDEVLGNITGGRKQGTIYEGLTDLSLSIDFKPATRGILFSRAYQIRGRGLSANYLDNLNTMSGIEAQRTTRLVELWYEQHFDNWRIRVGQQTIGSEFLSPESARLFVNGAFGWPTLPATNLPSGGPGYPLGTPAVRVRVDPFEGLTLFTAVFNGDPTGAGVGGSQLADASGTAFRVGDGAFVISEIRYNEASSDHNPSYRIGGWYNTERFPDRHFDTAGLSLANPASNGKPLQHGGDYSLYASVDLPLLEPDSKTGFLLFARAMGAPGDRNLVNFYGDAGVSYTNPFGLEGDKIGLAVGYARVGQAARDLDSDTAQFIGQSFPVRSGEAILELTYQHQLAGWWQVQPDFQYIINPGGGIPNPIAPSRRIGDAAVLGIRSVVTF